MGTYSVTVSSDANAAIEEAFLYIQSSSPANALRWLQELYDAIDTLDTFPERCAVIREQAEFKTEIRAYFHYSHRLIFTVNEKEKTVQVLAFRHSAMDDLSKDDL